MPNNYKRPIAVHVLTVLSLAAFLFIALVLFVLVSQGYDMPVQDTQNLKCQILMAGLFGFTFGTMSLALDYLAFKKFTVNKFKHMEQ